MKMYLLLLIFIASNFIVKGLYGQEYKFIVIALKGTASYSENNSEQWIPLKTGQKLLSQYKIKLNENSYLALVHKDGKTVELKKEGTFTIDDIEKKLKSSNSPILKKITDFLVNEMSINTDKVKQMKMHGAVVRAPSGVIETCVPNNSKILDKNLNLIWYPSTGNPKYIFRLVSPERKTVLRKELSDTAIALNTGSMDLKEGVRYKWYILSTENEGATSDSNFITLLSANEKKAIQDTLKEIRSQFPDKDSPLSHIVYASFFERNKIYFEALKHYELAQSSEANIDEYIYKYCQFLQTAGMMRKYESIISSFK